MVSLLRGLSEEKVVLLNAARAAKLPFPLRSVVRLVDAKGNTLAVFLNRETLETLGEDLEALNPDFQASLQASRASGRVTGKEVKRKARLK